MRTKENFVSWLMEITGDKPIEIANKTEVSPSLLSRYASCERRPTLAVLKKINAVYEINIDVLREKAELFRSKLRGDSDGDKDEKSRRLLELEEQLSTLRNPRFALIYSLRGKLSQTQIEKLIEIVMLELKYAPVSNEANNEF